MIEPEPSTLKVLFHDHPELPNGNPNSFISPDPIYPETASEDYSKSHQLDIVPDEFHPLQTPEDEVTQADLLLQDWKAAKQWEHLLFSHSNASTKKIMNILGLSDFDPNPNQEISFTDCHCPDEVVYGQELM